MTQRMIVAFTFWLMATLVGCNPPDLDANEVMSKVFTEKGVVGGYDFGASWDEVKKNHDDVFEVRDDEFKQLRRAVSDNAGDNGYFIGFHLDEQGKVKSFNVSISGSKQNAVTVRKLLDDIMTKLEKSHGKGSCSRTGQGNSSSCTWPAGKDKGRVELMYLEMDDPISGHINMQIHPPEGAS